MFIVLANNGVFEIECTVEKQVGPNIIEFIQVRSLSTGMRVLVDKEKGKWRHLMSYEKAVEIDTLLRESIPYQETGLSWKDQFIAYRNAIEDCDLDKCVEGIRNLRAKEDITKLNFSEKKILQTMETLLEPEISIALIQGAE